jgi:acyl dehydratase
MTLDSNPRYFEDYPPGAVFEGGTITVNESDIVDFARRYDPQTMHTDPAAAAHGFFGGLIASGWHTLFCRRLRASPRPVSMNCAGSSRCDPATC